MEKILLTLPLTVFAAGIYSITCGQQPVNNFAEAVVYKPEMNSYMADPNQALLETTNDKHMHFVILKSDSVAGGYKFESKIDLADPNLDLKISDKELIKINEKFKKESEDNIQKNEKCLSDLKGRIKDNKKADSTIFRTDVEILDQKNSVLKIRLANYYNANAKEAFSSFKSNFDEDLESVTNAILELAVNIIQ